MGTSGLENRAGAKRAGDRGVQEAVRGLLARARQATEQRDWLEAWRCWDAIRLSSPEHAATAYLGAGQALREAGRYDDAELALGDGAERFPDDERIATARAWLANARRDWPKALSRWEAARARFPHNPWCYLGSIRALQGAGRSDGIETLFAAAESALAAAKERGLDPMTALRAEFEIARIRSDWPAVRQCAEKIIAADAAPTAQVFLALAQARWHLGDAEEADRAALRALSADPALVDALLVRVWVATARGDGETALACYQTLVKLNPGAVRWALKLVQLLNWLGRVPEAAGELENIRGRWPSNPLVVTFLRNYGPASDGADWLGAANRPAGDSEHSPPPLVADPDRTKDEELHTIASRAPHPDKYLRPVVAADPEGDVLLAEVQGAQTAVLVFTGTNDELSLPLPLFDRYLAALNLTTIYLKDFNRLRFLQGIRSLSDDYAGTIQALRKMVNHLGVTRLCAIGNCVGGFAAIRYGVELGAHRILAFGSPTFSSNDPLMNMEEGRRFMRTRLEAKVPSEMTDLKPFLESRRHSSRIELFYEEQDPRDRMNALRLSGLTGVTLHSQPELSYRVLRRLARSHQDFGGTLAEFLVGRSMTRARN
jgi:tetratricopeptide (TPR) repeat protein